jgi:tripartite-type tricarboxylate transporter receptor subunit TctC
MSRELHMSRRALLSGFLFALSPLPFAMFASTSSAQSDVASFYKGKTLEMIVGYAAGSSNDIAAREVAKYLPRHLPGAPNIVTRNMPGGGSFVAGNYIYNIAAKDGTVLGLLAPTIAIDEKMGTSGVKFVTSKFDWIGRETTSVGVTMVWHTSKVQTIADAFTNEVTMAATGAGSTTAIYPNVLNNVLGTKFKLIMGYAGSNEAMLAMERGEADGHSVAFEQVTSQHPDWLADGRIRIIVQYALARHPALPDVPTALDIAKTDEQRAILHAVVSASDVGKSILTTPDVPAERVAALRAAFDATMKDPDFIADMTAVHIDVIPMSGDELQKMVGELGDMSPSLTAEVKKIYVMPGD